MKSIKVVRDIYMSIIRCFDVLVYTLPLSARKGVPVIH